MAEISVIMGVYNQFNKDALFASVNSILNQTFSDFEFIIYDDGSRPEATRLLREIQLLDDRIVLIGQEENHGLAFSLNACIAVSKGKYIARMDADDVSLPDRLRRQKEFLDTHQEYGWCGTNAGLFDDNGVWGSRKMPERPEKEDYLKYSPYIHPTVMYRKDIFVDASGYKVSNVTLRCEDYELFMRLRRMGLRGYNIQEELFRYREDNESFRKRKMKYRINEARLRYRNFKEMGLLWPRGWIYVLRPIIAGFIPAKAVALLKRKESGFEKQIIQDAGSIPCHSDFGSLRFRRSGNCN